SQFMLNRCRSGLYSQLEINRGLPASYLVKHFERNGTEWQIKAEFRKMIDFRFLNLSGEWPSMPTMDLIMMRNVLIYFDTDMKKRILL
ncbi:MAG: protein-glutamate O-methyltransferase CheR, partial [Nitrospinaceae bacterium]|nr:protein-glutamate O-methyltransferase CheR [Nitrospinaceae bacterium]NIR55166.1 protein-glutamate O-methyltransferase CheR [Nitrospinaceae bacterium]NIS85590.1 protein-glutamate O-methyltransferase CheR [Nitrospinaceae bacterium]NIT82436.1 protein-glutamate O-methyltransferase CheR [Nitrospinaceae bacterium]NIU44647.1 protein-glutamate O-methyltransferase CheR [Nitrospinaceae bacterium]